MPKFILHYIPEDTGAYKIVTAAELSGVELSLLKSGMSMYIWVLLLRYDCSIIFPRETYAIGNYTSITVTLLMNKCRIPFASCSNSTSKVSLVSVYKSRHQHVCKVYRIYGEGINITSYIFNSNIRLPAAPGCQLVQLLWLRPRLRLDVGC